jgi:hypothetical protein
MVNGTIVDLGEGTQLELSTLDVSDSHQRVDLRLFAGRLYNRVEKLLGQDDFFHITTPSSTASVRGTAFQVDIVDANSTSYIVDTGIVAVALDQDEIDVHKGEEVLATRGQPLQVIPQNDTNAPDLFIISPISQPVSGSTVTVRGRTEPGTQITVAGQSAAVDASGNFQLDVVAGANPISVIAIDSTGNRVSVEIETRR